MKQRERVKLGELFKSRRECGKAGLPLMSVTLNNGLVERGTLDRKTDSDLAPEQHLLIKKGDIAYNMMRMWQGASGLAENDGLVSPAYVVVAPKNGLDSQFAAYWFKSPRMIYLFWAYSYGLTQDRLRLYYKDFAKIPTYLPSSEEQPKIAAILKTWDTAITQTEQLIAAKQKLKKGLMQQLLTGKCRISNSKIKWVTVRIDEICKIVIGGTPERKTQKYWATPGTGHAWLSIRDMTDKWITNTKETITDEGAKRSNVKLIPRGTTLMSFKLTIGKVARAAIELYTNEAIAAFFPKDERVTQDFLYLSLPYAAHRTATDQAIKGATLNKEKLSAMLLKLPPIDEQREVVKILDLMENDISNLNKKLNKLKEQKRGLMQKLLTGQVRVKA